MAQGSGLTRGDRNRNRRIAALRQAVARDRAVLAVDLGEDKQVAVRMDHEGRVLARKVVRAKAHQLADLLAWAAERAVRAGFAGLVVGRSGQLSTSRRNAWLSAISAPCLALSSSREPASRQLRICPHPPLILRRSWTNSSFEVV